MLADHKKWDAWWVSHWSYLLTQLDSVKEGDGTLLDNTLIVFGSDTTTGQSCIRGARVWSRYQYVWNVGSRQRADRRTDVAYGNGHCVDGEPAPATRDVSPLPVGAFALVQR